MASKLIQTWGQYILPHHLLSRCVGKLTHCQWPALKNVAIDKFISRFGVDMSEAINSDPHSYKSFNEFFTRHLKPGARAIDANQNAIVSPVDGTISQLGKINQGRIFQAKGFDYSTSELLGGNETEAKRFVDGEFITIYLSPKDYHRVHMPYGGTLRKMIYVPGKLFSVNPITVDHVPRLFSRNERVICLFDTKLGPMAVILVGAMLVASMHTQWAGQITPGNKKQIQGWNYTGQKASHISKGGEMGYFTLGSTVIVLFSPNQITWDPSHKANSPIKMGQNLATRING